LGAVATGTFICAVKWPSIGKVLFVAFAVRTLASIVNLYITALPDSTTDAMNFERIAWEWSRGGFSVTLDHFPGPDSYFISWLLGLFYSATGRSALLAQSVTMLFGMGTIVIGWFVARELWGSRAAQKTAWVLALFPTLVLYSVLTMREAYVWFFFLVALLGMIRWARNDSWKSAGLALAGFLAATFFHGAMLIGALVFLALASARAVRQLVLSLSQSRLHIVAVFTAVLASAGVVTYVTTDIPVPKLGTFEQVTAVERSLRIFASSTRDTASYPEWTIPRSASELIWKAPLRMVYFFFSPFPWDVSSPRHAIGLVDGLLYMTLVGFIWRNRRRIRSDPGSRAILVVIGVVGLVFAIALGNFGTGIRHRAKFVAALVVLAAPRLPGVRVWPARNERAAGPWPNDESPARHHGTRYGGRSACS